MEKGFIYEQSTGTFAVRNGDYECPLFSGSAGSGAHSNRPDSQKLIAKGPLPQGEYSMRVVAHRRFASPAIALRQEKGETFGRSAFYIHGGTKSEGCILLQHADRSVVASLLRAGFRTLWVRP